MIVKKAKIRRDISCSGCMRTIKAGNHAIIVYDYDEIPYNDKYFCGKGCYHSEAFIDTCLVLTEEKNA